MTNTASYPKPNHIGDWELDQIIDALSRPIPPDLLESKTLKGKRIDYLSWHQATKILNKYALGWQWEIVSLTTTSDRLFLVGKLSIPTPSGVISRCATGTEELACSSYGDPSSNAESMAFRRAAAKFGLALYLY